MEKGNEGGGRRGSEEKSAPRPSAVKPNVLVLFRAKGDILWNINADFSQGKAAPNCSIKNIEDLTST